MATADASGGGFRRWRRSRPFWGGLLLLISGLELFLSANLTLGDLAVHFGPEGFLSYLLPLLLVLCGLLTWLTPGQRLFYGILGMLTAVYSLIGLNLGGFGIGMLIGILGGALAVAWSPARPKPAATPPAAAESDSDSDAESDPAGQQPEAPAEHDPAATMIIPGFSGGPEDTGLRPPQPSPAQQAQQTQQVQFGQQPPPGQEPPHPPSGGGGIHRKALVITLVPLLVTAALVVAGGQQPARAETECPEGLPSRPAAAAKKEAAKQSSAKPRKATAAKRSPTAKAKASASASPTPTATETDEDTGNVIVDGWNDFVDGVGDLLGVGDDETTEEAATEAEESTSPSADPSPSASAEPSTSTSVDPSTPATDPSADPSGSTDPSTPASSAAPSPTPSLPDIPCLGPRVFKEADPDDIPQVSLDEGLLETDSLTMYDSTYDGVIDVPTAQGTKKVLKFSMNKAVNKPFSLTVTEPGKHTTLIESKELITDGNVRFYTPKFQGNLFGIIPVTFTPEEPPPLTLPILWFTKVKIELAYVRCDTLTGSPLSVTEKS